MWHCERIQHVSFGLCLVAATACAGQPAERGGGFTPPAARGETSLDERTATPQDSLHNQTSVRAETSPSGESASAPTSNHAAADPMVAAPTTVPPLDTREQRKPAAVVPPFARSAKPGDGEWSAYGETATGTAGLWTTVLHPHPISSFITVTVVAIDLRQVRLEWVVGSGDDGAASLSKHMTPGFIPQASLASAIAVFNGGFQARHGRWGQVSHGVTLVEPQATGCGVALDDEGNVDIGTFEAVGKRAEVVTYRQTPPCLVSDGELNQALLTGSAKAWAGKSQREKTRRRSALGVSRETATLYYLVGVETEALDLGRALVALNADQGLQLDINWNWTRFFLVNSEHESAPVHSPLVSGMVMDVGEYVKRPSKRDFFVVRWR